MINQTLNNRYKITSRLGEGGMGEVYLADDEQTKQKVAVKILARQLVTNTGLIERFKREAETLQKLDHPNIVKFIDEFEYEGQYVIVMEYVSGGNLQDLLKKGRLPIEHAKRIALELCDALIRSHHLNIIHRDIKPENILMTKDGKPKLADFGVARLNEGSRMTRTGTQVGTPYYMSPEAWEGKQLDAQTDIWSLGVMLFEMLTGQVPFEGDTGAVVMNKVLTTQLPNLHELRKEVPKGIANIVTGMLLRDKKQRYESMRQVAADLEKGKSSIDLNRTRIIPNELGQQRSRKNLLFVTGGIIGLLAILWGVLGNPNSASSNNNVALKVTSTKELQPTLIEFPLTSTIAPTPTLSYPLLIGTPIPNAEKISLDNVDQLTEIARWGNGKINSLVISPDNKTVYAGSSMGLYFYDANTFEEIKYIPRNSIYSLIISPDSKYLSFIEDSKVITLSLETNEEQIKYEETGIFKLQYLPNGELYAIKSISKTNGIVDSLQIINLESSSLVTELNNIDTFYRLEISPTGKNVALTDKQKTIITYDLTTSKESGSYGGVEAGINSITYSSDEKLIASGGLDGKIYIWNLESGQPVHIFSAIKSISYLKFSPDNTKILASLSNGIIQSWDLATGEVDASFTGQVSGSAFSFSQDSTLLISPSSLDGRGILWSYPDGKRLAEISNNSAGITSLDISPDGSVLATGAIDNTIVLWSPLNGEVLKDFVDSSDSFGSIDSLDFSPDGLWLAAGNAYQEGTLWDVSSGKQIRTYVGGNSFAFCHNQSFSISADNKALFFLDAITGLETFKISGNTCSVDDVACSSDGELFAYRGTGPNCGTDPDRVILTKIDNMVELFQFRTESSYNGVLTFSPDGSLLAGSAGDEIRFWETSTGKEISGPKINDIFFNPSTTRIIINFSPDGNILAYLSDYNKISFFDIANNITISTIETTTSNFRAFKFSPDGKYLITGHSDGTIRIWGIKP